MAGWDSQNQPSSFQMLSWTYEQFSVEVDSQRQVIRASGLPSSLEGWGAGQFWDAATWWMGYRLPGVPVASMSLAANPDHSDLLHQNFDVVVSARHRRKSLFPICRRLTCIKYHYLRHSIPVFTQHLLKP